MKSTLDCLWIIFILFSARNFNVEAAEKMLRDVSRIQKFMLITVPLLVSKVLNDT
jgi:hypothetical protein